MTKKTMMYLAFGFYPILCLLPYFISGLNTPEPWIGPFPFTIAYAIVVVLYGCAALYIAAQTVWKEDEEKGEKI